MTNEQLNQNADGDFPHLTNAGLSGLLVTFAPCLTDRANRAAIAFRAAVDAEAIPGITETTTSLVSTYIVFDPLSILRDQLRGKISSILASRDWYDVELPKGRRLWRIPAAFGGDNGPQLEEAAACAGVSVDQALEDFATTRLRVMTIGFAPGQPYLGTLDERWNISRQSSLTKRIPAGSLVVAVRQIVLYTHESPTGWRRIGQTAFPNFRADADNPFSFNVGDEVAFVPVAAQRLKDFASQSDVGGAEAEPIL